MLKIRALKTASRLRFSSQNENEDRQKEIAMEAKIEKRRTLAAEKAMGESVRLQKALNVWFGLVLKKSFLMWKSYIGWRRGGKALHIQNVVAWRRQRDLKNTLKALRGLCVRARLQRKLESSDAG
jgi:hypothetical protein